MGSVDKFGRWAKRAREEPAPEPYVAETVMRRLSEAQPQTGTWLPVWLLSGATACAAVIFAVLGVQAWVAVSDPFGTWMQDLATWGVL